MTLPRRQRWGVPSRAGVIRGDRPSTFLYAIETSPGCTSLPAGRSKPQGPFLKLTLDDLRELGHLIGDDVAVAGAWVEQRVQELNAAREEMLREDAS